MNVRTYPRNRNAGALAIGYCRLLLNGHDIGVLLSTASGAVAFLLSINQCVTQNVTVLKKRMDGISGFPFSIEIPSVRIDNGNWRACPFHRRYATRR